MQVANGTTIRPDLADATSEYGKNLESQFMGQELLPIAGTAFQSGTFGRLKIESVTDLSGDLKRAPGAAYSRQQHDIENDNYTCEEYGVEETIDDGEAKRIGIYTNAEMSTTNICRFRLKRAQERRVATLLWDAGNFAGFTGGVGTEWDNSGNVVNDVQDAIFTMKKNCGGAIEGEICVAFSEKVFRNIMKNSTFQALLPGGTGGQKAKNIAVMKADEMAMILGVDKVFYSAAQWAGADVWDDEYALVFVRSTSPSLAESVQLGRSMLWTADSPSDVVVESYREEATRSNVIRVRQYIDEKVFAYRAGYLLSNITK